MNKYMKKVISWFLIAMTLLAFPMTSFALESEPSLVVTFQDFTFGTNDYLADEVNIEYVREGNLEKAIIRDKDTNQILETMIVERTGARAVVTPYIFTRSTSYGRTTVQLSINVELYNDGSFRQINSLQGSYLTISSSITPTYIEGQNVNVWSPGNVFPTTELMYAYNGTLTAEVEVETSGSISAELLGAGFEYSYSAGSKIYYRRTFNTTGTISLY